MKYHHKISDFLTVVLVDKYIFITAGKSSKSF